VMGFDPVAGKVLNTENLGVPKPMVSARLHYWSPTAEELAIEDFASDSKHVLWIMDYPTRKLRKVLEFGSATFSGLAWSADGRSIIYSGLVAGRQQLMQVAREGGTPKQISYEPFGNLILPTVSPDGKWIAATRVVTSRALWKVPLDKM
jgi:Tol biopolymer transport system component